MDSKVLVPRLSHEFHEPVVELAILEAFQKLGYDHPSEDQALAIRNFVLGSDAFVMLPTGSVSRCATPRFPTSMTVYVKLPDLLMHITV